MDGQFVSSALMALPLYAALDLGTNNCRLLIAAAEGDGFRVVDSFSRLVRLGEGLHSTGRLSPPAMERTLAALHACAGRLRRRPVKSLYAIATEACRRAENGVDFLATARAETGLPIEVISSREEVELALESCMPLLPAEGRRALLFDIGGGSTELAWVRLEGRRAQLIGYASLPVGVSTLAEQFGEAATTLDGFAAMVALVAEQIAPFESVHRIAAEIRHGGVVLLGTSGTATTLAGITLGLQRYRRAEVDGAVLTGADADAAVSVLQGLGRAGRAAHPCIGPDREPFVLPGCAVFVALRAAWPAERVLVADRGLREAMLLRQIRGGLQRRRPASRRR